MPKFLRKHGLKLSKSNHEYVPAKLVEGTSRWYIEFWVWSEAEEKLVRKRIGLGKAKTLKEKRAIAHQKISQINQILYDGYVIKEEDHPQTKVINTKSYSLKEGLIHAQSVKGSFLSKRSMQEYNTMTKYFLEWAKGEGLSSLDVSLFGRKEAYRFRDFLSIEKDLKNRTVNNYISRLRALFNVLTEREIVMKNPTVGIKKLPSSSEVHTVYSPQQRMLLEDYLARTSPLLFLFTRFIYYGFLRPIEICRLKRKNIDLENRVIVLSANQSKSKKMQSIYIVDPLQEIIEGSHLVNLPGDFFIFSKELKPGTKELYRNRVSEMHRKVLEETGLYDGKLTMYSWRHTGACNAYRAGVDIKTLQGLLRHHSLDMTAIYLRSMGLRVDENLKGKSW